MSTRRSVLTSNPNAANSPIRANLGATIGGKRLRSHADLQREEAYGQPPPAKRQMTEHHGLQQRPSLRAPSTQRSSRPVAQRQVARGTAVEKPSHQIYKPSEKEIENVKIWQEQTKARFPKMVVYFDCIPEDERKKRSREVQKLGGREEKFFSIDITHVVTSRPIPSEKAVQEELQSHTDAHAHEQPKTIDPSLLNRPAEQPVKRKLVFDTAVSRRMPLQVHEDVLRKPKPRNTDVLYKAREMGKKIWPLEKMQKILDMVSENDPYKSALLGQGHRTGTLQTASTSKVVEQSNLLQLLQNERVHGPSDRDPTVATQELNYFKGPYIYVYDIEEKMKPIMVREYTKVADKKDGAWPQFRIAAQGRCPFVEDQPERQKVKERVTKAAETRAPVANQSQVAPSKYKPEEVARLRQHNSDRKMSVDHDVVRVREGHHVPDDKVHQDHRRDEGHREHVHKPRLEFDQENAFMSRAKAPRFVAGEPVASGVQPSKLTSAIRSQMISSTSGILGGIKAGTSKEIHGLQRKVLQKNSTPAVSDLSSRRLTEMSHDSNTFIRSTSVSRPSVRGKLDMIDEDGAVSQRVGLRRTESAPAPVQEKQKKRELKPGYCENCADKFDDFDDHILTRKHRKFAEDKKNWAQLDDLLSQLSRRPRYDYIERSHEEIC
ncbi:Dfp1/Him1, central region-domain-containing protein [Coniochaeta sp. 2T2.1]|nr:Dfp1/Him1, central region-domain-containing protein [Coniochaeta sp. 2T2.1]